MTEEPESEIRQDCHLSPKEENLLERLPLLPRLRFLQDRRQLDAELERLIARDDSMRRGWSGQAPRGL